MFKSLVLILYWSMVQTNLMTDSRLAAFLSYLNQDLEVMYDQETLSLFQNEVNSSNNMAALQAEEANEQLKDYIKRINPQATKFKRLELGDSLQRRQLSRVPDVGYGALSKVEEQQVYALLTDMGESYQNVMLCAYSQPRNCTLRLIPDVQRKIQKSSNVEEIEYYWLEWRRYAGLAVRQQFTTFMELYKKTAVLNGFSNAENYWFRELELSSGDTMALLNKLMSDLRPLFIEFHAYVRGTLRKMHGEQLIPRNRPYPQHLAEVFLGNAFVGTRVDKLADLPSPEVGIVNITEALNRRGLSTTRRVFWNVAEFYRGLGLPQLDNHYWDLTKPVDYHSGDECWHNAWRYYGQSSANFTYCPLNDEERFFNMFEAQMDLQYFRATAAHETMFRKEPFSNFGDALGKCFFLAATSPRYLRKLGLLQGVQWSNLPGRLNELYMKGLRVVFLLPVFYVLDRYRVVLSGQIKADDNKAYWILTEMYTGAARRGGTK